MSGGVDSSVAAFLLKNDGYDCIGATMRLFDNEDAGIPREKSCCSLEDVEDARSVAFRLAIPYYVFNFTTDFKKQVIDGFINAYQQGLTPNPCIDCNRYLKFDRLYARAAELGCDFIATGHYARIETGDGRMLLKKAADSSKDQSYVLYAMTQEQLAHTRFPLGDLHKAKTRKIAEEQGFLNAKKHDSQDICFVPDGDYAKVIELQTGKTYHPGKFVDGQGNVLGTHRGIIHYTVGQRHGLGISFPTPLYVTAINSQDNTVVLGADAELLQKELDANDFNWIVYDIPPKTLRAKAKIRYKQEEQWATVSPTGENSVHLVFDEPQRAIAKGQAVVLYDGEIVIGGGTICESDVGDR